ncbi:MAG: VOC family protein [Phycisphaerales bacterium]|nr:VOC family protein [Phycisphaerales bacterium]
MAHPVVHFEIGAKDINKLKSFYSNLFEWQYQEYGPAAMVAPQGGQGIGGHINAIGHEPHNYVTVYVQVDDIEAKLAEAEKLGGKCIVPKQEVPQMGWFAWIQDPEGNCIGLWKTM